MNYKIFRALRRYHRHDVIGMDNIPSSGRALLVFNHSLATYDIPLMWSAIYDHHNRVTRALADNQFFSVGLFEMFVRALGAVQGRPDEAQQLLMGGELVAVAPGGMYEMLRPSSQRYQLCWTKRRGFVRLAIQTQTPIILAVCPRADDIYDVYENPITTWVYDRFRWPFPIARGVGATLLPRPIKLIHYVDRPINPPKASITQKGLEVQIARLHRKVCERAEFLMSKNQ